MDAALQAQLDRLDSLSLDELTALRDELATAIQAAEERPLTGQVVDELNELAAAAETLGTTRTKLEAFTASGNSSGRPARRPLSSFQRNANPVLERPRPSGPSSRVLTASGRELDDASGIVEEFSTRLRGTQSGTGRTTVVQLESSMPEDRRLTQDPHHNLRVIDAVAGPAALTASGGICKPVNVLYDIPGLATAQRPIQAALPSFQATRGGVQLPAPRDIGDLAGGLSVWTASNDRNPGGANTGPNGVGPGPVTKPTLTTDCYNYTEVDVSAITQSVTFGNMRARFSAEGLQADLDLLRAAHARLAESTLVSTIAAGSTAVTWGQVLGAARDLLVLVDRAAVAYRSRHRMDDAAVIQVLLPSWVRGMIRSDLTKAAFPYEGDSGNSLAVTDAQIDALLAARNVVPTFSPDMQVLGAQSAGALLAWPSAVVMYLFAPGTWLFLDGGTLDLGVVRDSALNRTNDAEFFSESFESVAKAGLESLAITATVAPNGAASGTITPA